MPTSTASAPRITIRCENCRTWNRVRADRVADGPRCGSCASPIAFDRPVHLDNESFDRVLRETEIPVLVDFYADWCGPCRMMAPAVEELAKESAGKALIAKLDTDRAQEAASRFPMRGIPTVIVFQNGKEVARQTGAVPLAVLRKLIPLT